MKKYIYGHISPETAYVVEGYPWGFRLRTKIRYWVETSEARGGGQRFCSQTVNPKTGQWCAPKKSIYQTIMVMTLDEEGHVHYVCTHRYSTSEELEEFKDRHLEHLNDYQKKGLEKELVMKKTFERIYAPV